MLGREKKAERARQARHPGEGLGTTKRVRVAGRRWFINLMPIFSVIFLGALIVVPAGLFGWLLVGTDVFKVQSITVVDAREHTMDEARQIVKQGIEDLPLDNNIFLVNTDALEILITTRIPQVRTVHVTRKLPGTIKVIIQEKTPAMLLASNGNYYFVDEQGIVYEEASLDTLPGVVLPIVKNDDREAKVAIGVRAVSDTFVKFIDELEEVLQPKVGAQIGEIHIPSLAAREVLVVLDNNWTLLLDATRGAEQQARVMRQLLIDKIAEEDRDKLEYVDLRIPNRVYYRLINSNQ